MRFVVCLLLCLGCLAPVPSAAKIDFGHYHALVIGNNAYKHLPELKTAEADARGVHELLTRRYGYKSTLLLNVTRDELIRNLDRLRQELTEDDNLLIYYAGHGYLDKLTGEGFWLPVDAEEDSQVEWIPLSTVTRMLLASTAKQALVVADSCYSGTLTRDAGAHLQTGSKREIELERLSQKRARKALTSGGLEPVADSGRHGHSVFTGAFLDVLGHNHEVMDGYQLYRVLRRDVVLNAKQTPQYADIRFAGDEGGDFLFVPVNAQVGPSADAPAGGNPVIARAETTASLPTGGYLTGEQIRQKVIGNTISFAAGGVGTVHIFFQPDGVVKIRRADHPEQTFEKKWWLKHGNRLCRTGGKDDKVHCPFVALDQGGKAVRFFKSDGSLAFRALLLPGEATLP